MPFCFHKCHYCDFYSLVESEQHDRQEAFTDRLIEELNWAVGRVELRPRTIFVGGGTPTLLRVDLWRRFLEALHRLVPMAGVEEFTVEANPETVTPELIELLVSGGVNRMSVGAQSFQPDLLKMLERWHDPANVARAVGMIRAGGIDNVNLDLIFAIPGQTIQTLDADLDAALALGPTHLSCYGLTYEPNTAMTQRLRMGKLRRVDEEIETEMYGRVLDRLDAAGFERYEVSNWARVDTRSNQCRHNLAYWTNANWLGIGPSAASHLDGYRWKNEAHLGRYLSQSPQPPTIDHEHLPEDRRIGELLMLGLRLREGVALAWLDEHVAPNDSRRATIAEMMAIGMMEHTPTHLRLTRRGLFVADAVIGKLL